MAQVDPFEVRGELSVRSSATVVCVRRRSDGPRAPRAPFARRLREEFGEKVGLQPFMKNFVKQDPDFTFESDWEVLLGQNEVVNFLKTDQDHLVTMRYPGEYKLAGGNVDEGESVEEAAKRELQEEFLRPAETQVEAEDIVLRPFSVKQTRPIRSRSNLMFNFVAIADENLWLNNLDIDEVNAALKARRKEFYAMAQYPDSPFWSYTKEEKEEICPEVYELRWVPLEEAVQHCLTSLMDGVPVNQWQQDEFQKVGRKRRDPMVMTGAVLIELEIFPTVQSLVSYCSGVDLETLREEEQWLFSGMDNDDVVATFAKRLGKGNATNPSFKRLDMIRSLRDEQRRLMPQNRL